MKRGVFVIFVLAAFICTHVPPSIAQGADGYTYIDTPFEPDLCQNGFAPSWGGACHCFNNEYTGRYCDEKAEGQLSRSALKPVKTPAGTFILSASLLNYNQAVSFCSEIDSNFKPATRKDFSCNGTGIGCLNKETFILLKKQYGNRGFFWLDEVPNEDKAYYADLNDSTVYNTKKTNTATIQALCIRKD